MPATQSCQQRDPGIPSPDGTCHFDKLPRELRDSIYSLAFTRRSFHARRQSPQCSQHKQSVGFLLTCKRLHAEALESYYANTVFMVDDMTQLVTWFRRLPESTRQMIRSIGCGISMYILPLANWVAVDPETGREMESASKLKQLECIRKRLDREGISLRPGVLKAWVWDGRRWVWKP